MDSRPEQSYYILGGEASMAITPGDMVRDEVHPLLSGGTSLQVVAAVGMPVAPHMIRGKVLDWYNVTLRLGWRARGKAVLDGVFGWCASRDGSALPVPAWCLAFLDSIPQYGPGASPSYSLHSPFNMPPSHL